MFGKKSTKNPTAVFAEGATLKLKFISLHPAHLALPAPVVLNLPIRSPSRNGIFIFVPILAFNLLQDNVFLTPQEDFWNELFKTAPTVRVDGVKQVYFVDPDGLWFEINVDVQK